MPRRRGLGGGTKEQPVTPAPPRPAPVRRPTGLPAGPVEVVVEVPVPPAETVKWFLDPARWTRFQGRTARLDPVAGGAIRIELGDGVAIAGRYVEIGETSLSFTWGRPGDATMPAEGSLVSVDASPLATGGSEVRLRHEGLADSGVADAHRSGWRYHLVRLAVAAGGATGDVERLELFLAAAGEPDGAARRGLLDRTCAATVIVADHVGEVTGVPALSEFLGKGAAAAPNRRLVRAGSVERVGAILRARYTGIERRLDGEAVTETGELVAALDHSNRFTAISLF